MAKDPEHKFDLFRFLGLLLPVALVAIALRVFVFGLYVVPTSSMAPTLLIGDYIVASKYAYGYTEIGSYGDMVQGTGLHLGPPPKRGDVVVFKSPWDGSTLVKRIIGLSGDRIQMYRSNLYINGELVKRERLQTPVSFPGDDEPAADIVDYIEYLPHGANHIIRLIRELEDEETVNNTPEVTVPSHNYFIMGDNRDNSDDSRVSDVGFVPEENILGHVETTFFSMSKSAHIWEFSKWSWALRKHRMFMRVH